MKIEYTTGCTKDSIDIDGEHIDNISPSKRLSLWYRLMDTIIEKGNVEDDLQDLLIWVCERYGITEHQFHCDECGDDVFTTTLNV